MSTGSKKRKRSERVSAVELPPGVWGHLRSHLRRGHVLVRLAVCALAAIALWFVTRGWAPPQPYRLGDIPERAITARTQFEQVDQDATRTAREDARKLSVAIFDQDPALLTNLRAKLENEVNQIVAADNLSNANEVWNSFRLPLAEGTPEPTTEERQQQYQRFREALLGEGALEKFKTALAEVFAPFEQSGLLDAMPADLEVNSERIAVRPIGSDGFESEVAVNEVLTEFAADRLQKSLEQKLPSLEVASRVFAWLRPKLPVTLKLSLESTLKEQEKRVAEVKDVTKIYPPGSVLARANDPINKSSLDLLDLEYQAELDQRSLSAKLGRTLAVIGMYVALYTLCGFYVHYRDPRISQELGRLATMLSLVVVTVALMLVTSRDEWRAEIIPLMLFGMTVAIAYQQELALLLTTAVALVAVEALGMPLSDALVLMATTVGAILLLRRVRSRSKLLTVGFVAAGVAFFTTIGVSALEGQFGGSVFKEALLLSVWAVVAGSLMTCLLPLVERIFGVQTDLSLIELGDPAHPLLQELIRRAPGTYNHSITVASLAESAAEAIGGRGLLVRVGAYFHDIGKMLKPGYFAENQGQGDNRHQSLVPAMSTLVIIAHVKDGADLARQNKIPAPIIDFIQQHHGTTLVEYFYRQASERKEADPNGGTVDESSFRYPGPKPQTKEAGILMLADAVESASRTLVEPTPARIESLVEDISRKRLLDGQFDECGLTLEEVRKIGDSLVKSLTAVYHGRVKYPDQESA
jgi:putative nucleotidyltransferase with HDIG domain